MKTLLSSLQRQLRSFCLPSRLGGQHLTRKSKLRVQQSFSRSSARCPRGSGPPPALHETVVLRDTRPDLLLLARQGPNLLHLPRVRWGNLAPMRVRMRRPHRPLVLRMMHSSPGLWSLYRRRCTTCRHGPSRLPRSHQALVSRLAQLRLLRCPRRRMNNVIWLLLSSALFSARVLRHISRRSLRRTLSSGRRFGLRRPKSCRAAEG